jgi:hypothetical protein
MSFLPFLQVDIFLQKNTKTETETWQILFSLRLCISMPVRQIDHLLQIIQLLSQISLQNLKKNT